MKEPISYLQMASTKMLESLYETYAKDPGSVDSSWRFFFEGVDFAAGGIESDVRTLYLIDAYRRFGYLKAALNPIALTSIEPPAELNLARFGLKESDRERSFPTFGVLPAKSATLAEILAKLESTYCTSVGYDYMNSPDEVRTFIEKKIEGEAARFSIEEKKQIFHHLNRAELFELFLHRRYVGQKRFSLEGAETLIPLMQELVAHGARVGVDELVIGMAHRGRLNVLANILGKSYAMIFSEFEDFYKEGATPTGDGDVKYHKGFSSTVGAAGGNKVHITLTANPSHLESVNPVVLGRTYAKQVRKKDVDKTKTLSLLVHGDASLPGQGIVYESMQLSKLDGYKTGGTLHICVENGIGFTTVAKEYRSMRGSSDLALAFGYPVFHVNAEDPEGAIFVARLALEVRQKFHIDVFINLYCYRKYGHNETDEPSFTQPKQYELIKSKPSIREIYRNYLITNSALEGKMAEQLEKSFQEELELNHVEMDKKKERPIESAFEDIWKPYKQAAKGELLQPVATGVKRETLKEIVENFSKVPTGFAIHPKLLHMVEERKKRSESQIDWALAEHMAFGSLLWEGTSVRLSGQDSKRGTFTQRHAVWVDQKSGDAYYPLAHLKEGQGAFYVYNSPLSEFGVLGFEFGYSLDAPETLVLWEAQFGDFANEAQVIIDQFITVSEQKWRRFSGLVLLLPHGYEGQGAEHSSARLERYLQLTAERNIQVVYPTTPAQYFHLLRRQMRRMIRIPLIIMTPKGLLRHPQCISTLQDLEEKKFEEIIDEGSGAQSKLILCTGRIYYDLLAHPDKDRAIVRIEQLYPLAKDRLREIFKKYERVKEVIWLQEEPKNMGAWSYLYPILQEFTSKKIRYVGRKRSAATAVGSHTAHEKEQEAIIKMVFENEKRD